MTIDRTSDEQLRTRARQLGFYGLVANWAEFGAEPWVPLLIDREDQERHHRSLERRIRQARLGKFKQIADFDWTWPKQIDRETVQELFSFQFIGETANVVLAGPNGVGKSMIAQNLAQQALLHGYSVRFTSGSAMLNDLAAQDGARALERRLKHYCQPQLLAIDEVGYFSYSNRHADLLFEVVNRRYQKLPIIITTNKAFDEWNSVFPNAACVVALIDRLVHRAEIVTIAGDSYRLKEANDRAAAKAATRTRARKGAA
jgi:DNA replication protein DnaC